MCDLLSRAISKTDVTDFVGEIRQYGVVWYPLTLNSVMMRIGLALQYEGSRVVICVLYALHRSAVPPPPNVVIGFILRTAHLSFTGCVWNVDERRI